MPFITVLDSQTNFDVKAGQSLLDAMRGAGISQTAPCGGKGTCGKCVIRVAEGELPPISEADRKHLTDAQLNSGHRLACMAYPESDLTIELVGASDAGLRVLDSFDDFGVEPDPYNGSNEHPFGIAIDIGTTTLGMCLVNLRTGMVEGRWSAVNKQREYGGDVISRIVSATKGKLGAMSASIRSQLSEGFNEICSSNGVSPGQLERIALAGNTTMLHLLLELDCSTLGVYPFTPVTLDAMTKPYGELFTGEYTCPVHILPGISTYVGADVSAGILYAGLHRSDKPELLVDIGTNGEMALSCKGELICTSTAAGPAFEGANIKWGTGSIPGAISTVEYKDEHFEIETISNEAPVGICGSGILDAVYQSTIGGLINKMGRLNKRFTSREIAIAQTVAGEDICITQKDVRELQLGKSAIFSGINILMDYAGVEPEEVGALYLAGGFGCHMHPESAYGIGMLPIELENRTKPLGNSCLGGLVYYLIKDDAPAQLQEIVDKSREFSLSEREEFNEQFITNTVLAAN